MAQTLRTPADVGATIRARRRELGWDQAELAAKIGASRLWVNEIEGGKPRAGLSLVLHAFAALGISLTAATPEEHKVGADSAAPVRSADINEIVRAARKKPAP